MKHMISDMAKETILNQKEMYDLIKKNPEITMTDLKAKFSQPEQFQLIVIILVTKGLIWINDSKYTVTKKEVDWN